MTHKKTTFIILAILILPLRAKATTPTFEISGWIPYWRTATGTADAISHITTFTSVNPFGYTVKRDGTLYDAMDIKSAPWQKLITTARANKVKVIPSVMWSDGNAIDRVLRDPKLRQVHINSIMAAVTNNNFDGIDIDYEGKLAETKNYFSLFFSYEILIVHQH